MMQEKISEELIKEAWHSYLMTGEMPASLGQPWFERKFFRPFVKNLPKSPRCHICYIPFEGFGGQISRVLWNVFPSNLNPHICNLCENFASAYQGGVELEFTMMFVDIRGSTTLAEHHPPEEYSNLIRRFYRAVTEEYYRGYGMVEKLLGDEVAGFFVPGFAGKGHARVAVETAKRVLKKLGYGSSNEPWIPVGIGINTGVAYIGSVSTEGGITNIAMLGDAVNTAARITAQAKAGEILFTDATRMGARYDVQGLESRHLMLKGKSEEVQAWVLGVG